MVLQSLPTRSLAAEPEGAEPTTDTNVPAVGDAPPPSPPAGKWTWKSPPSSRAALLERSRILREQIEELRQERAQYGIAGPIVAMGIGGGLMLTGFVLYTIPMECSGYESDFDGSPCEASDGAKTFAAVLGVGGLVLGIIGLTKLNERSGPRRELGQQILTKRSELRTLEQSLRLSILSGPHNTRGLSLALRF